MTYKWKKSLGGWGPDYIETPVGDFEVSTDGIHWFLQLPEDTFPQLRYHSMQHARSAAEIIANERAA